MSLRKVEYAASGRSCCKNCGKSIANDTLRFVIPRNEHDAFLHAHCLLPRYVWIGLFDQSGGVKLPGFTSLEPEDQILVKEKLEEILPQAKNKRTFEEISKEAQKKLEKTTKKLKKNGKLSNSP